MDKTEPIIKELEDGRIIKADQSGFSELIDGNWVPATDFDLKDFWDGKEASA